MSVDLSIHHVTKIEISEPHRNAGDHRTYDTRTITIHHDGKTTDVSLFSVDVKDEDDKPLSILV
tara:strand:- start:303 stop:494 length:192 start_codon:yes stop_codon:yes gene_type:complete